MSNFIGGLLLILLFGWIGSLFGEIGMWIGVCLGVLGLIGTLSESKDKKAAEPQDKIKHPMAPTAPTVPTANVAIATPKIRDTATMVMATGSPFKHVSDMHYVDTLVGLIAACIVVDAEIEEAEIEMATMLIENDELIADKHQALAKLKSYLDEFHGERQKSKAVFKLKLTTLVHKVRGLVKSASLSDLGKDRILVVLEGLLESTKKSGREEALAFVEKVREIFREGENKRLDSTLATAEQFILSSGDKEAIRSLRDMQSNPTTYKEKFAQAAKGNSVMRTAFGVFTGVIAANAVSNVVSSAIIQSQLEDTFSKLDSSAQGGTEVGNAIGLSDNSDTMDVSSEASGVDDSGDAEDIDTDFDV